MKSSEKLVGEIERQKLFAKQTFFQFKELTAYVSLNETEKGLWDGFKLELEKVKAEFIKESGQVLKRTKEIRDKLKL